MTSLPTRLRPRFTPPVSHRVRHARYLAIEIVILFNRPCASSIAFSASCPCEPGSRAEKTIRSKTGVAFSRTKV